MASGREQVIKMTELTLNNDQTRQTYTMTVPLDVHNKCSEDCSGMMARKIFEKIEETFTVNGEPKEKRLDYKESMRILADMKLLKSVVAVSKQTEGITVGTKAMFDSVSTLAFSKNLDDASIQALAKTAPSKFTPAQTVRYTEFLAASMPEDQLITGRTSSASSQDTQIESQSETQSLCDEEEFAGPSRTLWSDRATMLLIERRRGLTHLFESTTTTQKQAWRKVAEELQAKGYKYSGDECNRKFRALRGRHKTIKERNTKTGNSRQTWKFYSAMEEMYGGDPAVLPIAVASSICTESVENADISLATEEDAANKQSASTPRTNRKRKRFFSGPDETPQWLEKYQMEQRRMHDERMALEERRVTALENLVKLLEKKQ